jgi:hypothetical protein
MRRLGCFIAVFVGILVASAVATAALRVTVKPLEGNPRTKFTASFVVDRQLAGVQWFTFKVVGPVVQRDCEREETETVSHVRRGQRVDVVFRPFDRFRWCPGTYRGTVRVDRRVSCGGAEGPSTGPCWTEGSVIARFSFTVTP